MPLPRPPARKGDRIDVDALASSPDPKPELTDPERASVADARQPAAGDAPARSGGRRTRKPGALMQAMPPVAAPAAAPASRPSSTAPRAATPAPKAAKPAAKRADAVPVPAPETPSPRPASQGKLAAGAGKMFVLDTNVLMHDPMSLFRFEEHDVFLPMITLEELDNHKKGMSEVARNARQVSRDLDTLASAGSLDPGEGIPLAKTGHREAQGRLFFQTTLLDIRLPAGLPQGKADNQILGVVQSLRAQHPGREIVLVSKDINMRVKARALGLPAEDYFNDKTLEDGDLLYTGVQALPDDFWERHGKSIETWQQAGQTCYRLSGPLVPALRVNEFVYFEAPGAPSLHARVSEITGRSAVLRTLRDYTSPRNAVWGVTARNREQNFAMNLLMDPDCDFITLAGTAGTGKTLLTLAAALAQVLDDRRYSEIIVTRVTVPVGEDIGFLPGTEEEKMGPWMGALDDNLEVLARSDRGAGEWGRAATQDLVRSKIRIKSLNFMRGRTFLNKFVIIDEAQNLTPKQMKTLITRAGPGTKIVCLGNLAQIDTPYLTEGSSGLTYAVDRFKGWAHSGHVTLARGERSRLADYASEAL
jgi:PhoH-like ATPase